jgi:hypothetical protein
MITRHGKAKEEATAFTLLSSDYQTITVSAKELVLGMKSGKLIVNNLEYDGKKIVSTNGAMDNYTLIDTTTNTIVGEPKAVIIDRVEKGGKLVGYTMFNRAGKLVEISVVDASALAGMKLISNGKIRPTENGDIVSAIGGSYNLREIKLEEAPKGEIEINLMYFATTIGVDSEYFGAIISSSSAVEMSKIADELAESNARVIGNVKKISETATKSLGMQRFGANGVYGVFEIAELKKLLLKNPKALQNKAGVIAVSAVEYYPDGDTVGTIESVAKLSNSWKIIDGTFKNPKTEKAVKVLTNKVIMDFSKVNINK